MFFRLRPVCQIYCMLRLFVVVFFRSKHILDSRIFSPTPNYNLLAQGHSGLFCCFFKEKKKHCNRSSPSIYGPILILLHDYVLYYNNILERVKFERFMAKVKVTVAIFRKKNMFITLAPIFIHRFSFNFTQLSTMTLS